MQIDSRMGHAICKNIVFYKLTGNTKWQYPEKMTSTKQDLQGGTGWRAAIESSSKPGDVSQNLPKAGFDDRRSGFAS